MALEGSNNRGKRKEIEAAEASGTNEPDPALHANDSGSTPANSKGQVATNAKALPANKEFHYFASHKVANTCYCLRVHIKTKANSSNSHTAALVQSQKHHTVHSNASEFLALKIKDELEHHHFKGLAMNKCTARMVFSKSNTRWCYG